MIGIPFGPAESRASQARTSAKPNLRSASKKQTMNEFTLSNIRAKFLSLRFQVELNLTTVNCQYKNLTQCRGALLRDQMVAPTNSEAARPDQLRCNHTVTTRRFDLQSKRVSRQVLHTFETVFKLIVSVVIRWNPPKLLMALFVWLPAHL
jgi:hypothetical protein